MARPPKTIQSAELMTAHLSKEEIKRKADAAEARSRGDSAAAKELEVALSEGELDADVKKLAALPEGVYESTRVKEAKRLGVRASWLDDAIDAEHRKTKKSGNEFLPHWIVEPWPDPVDGVRY